MPRQRGAQPGNRNAVKHGFYSPHYRTIEIEDLDAALTTGLQDEIALMRISIRRLFELAEDAKTLEEWSTVLGSISQATTSLAALLRTDKLLAGTASNSIADALSKAIQEVTNDLKCK